MISTPAERVAAEVRAYLARERRTQRELAEHLGLSQQAVSRRLTGAQAFNINELHAVADYLGIDMTRLIAPQPAA